MCSVNSDPLHDRIRKHRESRPWAETYDLFIVFKLTSYNRWKQKGHQKSAHCYAWTPLSILPYKYGMYPRIVYLRSTCPEKRGS